MAPAASDVANHGEGREVVGTDNGSHLYLRAGLHRGVEDRSFIRMLLEVGPETARDYLLRRRPAGTHGMLEHSVRRPLDRQTHHACQRPHRARVI